MSIVKVLLVETKYLIPMKCTLKEEAGNARDAIDTREVRGCMKVYITTAKRGVKGVEEA